MELPTRTATDRFVLRCWETGDGPALYDAVQKSREHLDPWMPWIDECQSAAEYEVRILEFRDLFFRNENFFLGVWNPDETRVLGGSGMHLCEGTLQTCQAEIGMWTHVDETGKGLGTAVLREVLRWGFTEWPWLRMTWVCDANNVASRRCAERAGMRLEGIKRQLWTAKGRRDTALYAMLREDWSARDR